MLVRGRTAIDVLLAAFSALSLPNGGIREASDGSSGCGGWLWGGVRLLAEPSPNRSIVPEMLCPEAPMADGGTAAGVSPHPAARDGIGLVLLLSVRVSSLSQSLCPRGLSEGGSRSFLGFRGFSSFLVTAPASKEPGET